MDGGTDRPHRRSVKHTFDTIADHFACTREHPWMEVKQFVDSAPTVGRALDIGCANGRHAAVLTSRACTVIGLDVSRSLLSIALEQSAEIGYDFTPIQGDATTIPLVDDCINLGVYVATIHHLPSRTMRRQSLNELGRVLTPDGQAIVSTWSTEHERFDRDVGFDTMIDWTLPTGERVPRYYHIYDPMEFIEDLEASDLTLVSSFVSRGNCYATVTSPTRSVSTDECLS